MKYLIKVTGRIFYCVEKQFQHDVGFCCKGELQKFIFGRREVEIFNGVFFFADAPKKFGFVPEDAISNLNKTYIIKDIASDETHTQIINLLRDYYVEDANATIGMRTLNLIF